MKTITGTSKTPLFSLIICLIWLAIGAPTVGWAQFRSAFVYDNAVGPDGTARAHVGDMITSYIGVICFDDFGGTFTISYANDTVHFGAGDVVSSNLLSKPLILEPYVEFLDDVPYITNCYRARPGHGDYLTDHADVRGTVNFDGPGGSNFPEGFESIVGAEIKILQPAIQLQMARKGGGPEGDPITYSGTVRNCGNTLLTNVVVSSSLNPTLVALLDSTNLKAGEMMTFSGSYVSVGGKAAILTASGTDELGLTVSNSIVAAPMFLGITRIEGGMTLNWNTSPAWVYQVQYKTNYLQGNWINLGGSILASGDVATLSEATGTGAQRFYRVLLLPNDPKL